MKKFLPFRFTLLTHGFTLVELLIVISIIAILSTIGFAVYSGVQAKSRDARRRGDIDAIAKVLEVSYNNTTCGATVSTPYCPVTAGQFTAGVIPSNPSPGGAAYSGIPTSAVSSFNVCATLEAGGTFCIANQQ